MNLLEINKRIKQRPPFQMVERVVEHISGEYAKGIKCVSVNEPYFMGHFPDMPIMPGVLIIEACAQLCSLVIEGADADEDIVYVLLKAKDFKFIRPVVPGDQLVLEATKLVATAGYYTFKVTASVDGAVRAKGELAFSSARADQIYAN